LLIAVIVLFYLHFSGSKTAVVTEDNSSDTTKTAAPKVKKESRIYYVNIDTLNEKYEMLKDLVIKMKSKKAGLEADYQAKVQRYQETMGSYQQRLQENSITVDEARKVESDLEKQQMAIQNVENRVNQMMEELDAKNNEAKEELAAYLEEYKKGKSIDYILGYSSIIQSIVYGNDSLDITDEVLSGLNARYTEKKNTAPKK
jgi:outer membrane protein